MCFTAPYIGVRGKCSVDSPTSGLYINDLPGITFRRGTKTANEEDVTAKAMFTRLSELAVEAVKSDLLQMLNEGHQFNKVLTRSTYGRFDTDENTNTYVDGAGVEIEQVLKDPYTSIYIESIDLWPTTGSTIQITVSDGVQTEVCDVTTTGNGIHNVRIDFESSQEKITIVTDGFTGRNVEWNSLCDCEYDGLQVRGKIGSNYSGNMNGIRVRLQERCNPEAFFCQYENLLRRPILYKMGIMFVEEAMWTDRYNRFISNSEEQLMQMKSSWNGGVDPVSGYENKGEYWRQLRNAIGQLSRSLEKDDSRCLSCKKLKIISAIP